MTKFAINAVLAASLSLLVVAPAAAEEFTTQVTYGDLDLASPAGAKVLAQRVDAACARPDIRDLTAVMTASEGGKGLDNISLNLVMRTLADVQEASGDEQEAASTARKMVEVFGRMGLRPQVMRMIEQQAAAYQPGDDYRDPSTRRAINNHLDVSQIQQD